MAHELTETQRDYQSRARALAGTLLAPNAAAWDQAGRLPLDALKELGRAGMMGVTLPKALGGGGADAMSLVVAIEALAAGCASVSVMMSLNNSLVAGPLAKFGTADQQARYLAPILAGQSVGCFALTEPAAGSDAAALTLSAAPEDGGYALNGAKALITGADGADIALVFAVTDPDAGTKGISCFIAGPETPGYRVGRRYGKLGLRASGTAELTFENAHLSADAMLGAPGEGYRIALTALGASRLGMAAHALGIAQAAHDAALAHAKGRETFGKPIIAHQGVGFQLADMATEIEAARRLTYHAAELRGAGEDAIREVSMAKLFATRMAERVCSGAIQIFGGWGYVDDNPVERHYRDARAGQVLEGTNEILKLLISRGL